jgi:DNA transposition AAA+ family ATPase
MAKPDAARLGTGRNGQKGNAMSKDEKGIEPAAAEPDGIPTTGARAMAADQVFEATKDLPEKQRDAVRWMFAHMRMEGLSLAEAAKLVRRDASTLHRVFRNRYGAELDGIVGDIESLRRVVDERRSIASAGFVETSISRKVFQVCEWAIVSNSIVFIYGDSQIGKTCALEEYARRHNHGQTRMFRMPATAGVQLMMKCLARACLVSDNSAFDSLRERVLKVIDQNTLVIVDEVHATFSCYQKRAQVTCLELLRELHDRTRCGMVLCGTNVLREEVQRGKHKEMLEQLQRRGVVQLQLPARPPKKDLDAIARAYSLPAPEDEAEALVKTIITESGLGKLLKFVQAGTRLATRRNETFAWRHVITAHDILARLSDDGRA